MNFIITPFVNVISRLNLIWRFIIITMIVGVSLLYLVLNIVSKEMDDRQSTNKELEGVDLLLPTISILQNLQELRSLSIVSEFNPGSADKSKLDDLTNGVDKEFASLALSVHEYSDLNLESKYEELYNNWLKVKSKQGTKVDMFHLYDDYIDEPKDFLKAVTAVSDLNLDSDNNNYYFVQMVGVQFPELLESLTMLKDLTLKALYSKTVSDDTLNYLGYSIAIYDQNMAMLDNNIQYVDDSDSELKNDTKKVIQSLKDYNITKFVQDHILNKKLDYDPATFTENVNSQLASASRIFAKIANDISDNLMARKLQIRNQIISKSVGSCLILMLIGLIFTAFYKSTKKSLELAAESANEIANGNLAVTINTECKDDFKILFDAFITMQGNLCQIINDVNEVSNTVNSSAREISTGNANLSERTQEQASALVETASSLNNLTETVRKNAESAREATNLADKSSNIARKGQESVGNVLVTMGEINESAQKIQEITSVIDSIAFQTNLLALNASVEAARAGEQGRGFAVVASEVRNLAQRSSDAAKQIKLLINDSMSKVEAGDKQVKLTADTMQEILQSITQVDEIVKLISVASSEQSNGIEQINIVVSGMEDSTQKNAALVEEAAASAELLEQQSNKLVDVINRFTVA